ncbi:MAG: hypothetical protein QOG68_2152 [Solirubrobacteraceae bacterium]|jgi:beta-glucanase (GH16 family)|nr:hypothetical protein [Solirubrobacteraceae bacterium]
MPKRVLGVVVAGVLAATAFAAVQPGHRAGPPPVMHDEFGARHLDTQVWSPCHWWSSRGCTIASNHELEWYVPGQISTRGGVLRLTAQRRRVLGSDGRSHPYVSGMISSGPVGETGRPGFAFRYGRAEIRARVPAGRGLWSAFWLLPASRRSLPEIDVMEIRGQQPATVHMHLHHRGRGGGDLDQGGTWSAPALASGWHRFAIDWRPGRLRWLIDGVERFRVTGKSVPHEPMYLVANLAVGGDWPGPPDSATPFPSALEIDYLRVWR